MRTWPAILLFTVGCSGPAQPPASVETPAPAATPASVETPPPAPAPDAAPVEAIRTERDPREIGFVSAFAAYKSGGRDVYTDLSTSEEQTIAACFDRTMPLERRSPVVYYVHVYVPNPGHDAEQGGGGFGGGGAASGIGYPEPGAYADFEACVIAAIPEYRAPADVSRVELRMHVHTVAESQGTLGHGGGAP